MSEHKCVGGVWDRFNYITCGKNAKHEHEGQWYCGRHHPPTVQAKIDARQQTWRAKWEAQQLAAEEAQRAREEMQRKADAYDTVVAQRDALLEALKEATDVCIWPSTAFSDAFDKARAAIKKAEEGK